NQVSIKNSQINSRGSFGRIFIGINNDDEINKDLSNLSLPATVDINDNSRLNTNAPDSNAEGGRISIFAAGQVNIAGSSNISSQIRSENSENNVQERDANDFSIIEIISRNGSLSLDNIDISTNNSNPGFAGDIIINAREEVSINQSNLRSRGNQGRILIGKSEVGSQTSSPRTVNIDNNSLLSTVNRDIENADSQRINAGDISIDTDKLLVNNSSQIISSTVRNGNGGRINITAADKFTLAQNSQIRSRVVDGDGKSGGINIVAGSLEVTGKSEINTNISSNVTSGGSDAIIDIDINARSIRLNDESLITANSEAGDGGNINLTPRDLLLLRRNSFISTTAQGGNGGNIDIKAPNGFVVAVRRENSDIIANAFAGKGGSVDIEVTSLFGIQPLSREDLVRLLGNNPGELDPRRLPTSDITAISQENPNLSGQVNISALIDPSRGLTELPIALLDPSKQIDNSCSIGTSRPSSQFVNSGRGGLPANPNDPLQTDATVSRLVTLPKNPPNQTPPPQNIQSEQPIVEAQDAVRNGSRIKLVVNTSRGTSNGNWMSNQGCYVR
ncbi:MAG: S-layer family protein, partial [Calothrix sp. SM1_7_51]|nr:S-layer family protein [Calothrix sp. SM1_7_51]